LDHIRQSKAYKKDHYHYTIYLTVIAKAVALKKISPSIVESAVDKVMELSVEDGVEPTKELYDASVSILASLSLSKGVHRYLD
jgi:hypothetical protein